MGTISWFRSHRHRLKLAAKQGALAKKYDPRTASPSAIKELNLRTSFTHSPNQPIDSRPILTYSHYGRPNAYWEFGAMKLWNMYSNYPLISEWVVQQTKWGFRMGALAALFLTTECAFSYYFCNDLGTNPYVRGFAGFISGIGVARMASQGFFLFLFCFWLKICTFLIFRCEIAKSKKKKNL